jgi:hypothetical protein
MLNFFFFFSSQVPTQMGSLSAKNASKKFSRLGTFKDHVIYLIFLKLYFHAAKLLTYTSNHWLVLATLAHGGLSQQPVLKPNS